MKRLRQTGRQACADGNDPSCMFDSPGCTRCDYVEDYVDDCDICGREREVDDLATNADDITYCITDRGNCA